MLKKNEIPWKCSWLFKSEEKGLEEEIPAGLGAVGSEWNLPHPQNLSFFCCNHWVGRSRTPHGNLGTQVFWGGNPRPSARD